MATAQKQRNCVSAVVFPNKISTEQQSLMLVKRLLAVAVSCITYLRGIFPESAYGTRYMDDICVKILREDKNCPGSTQLVKWSIPIQKILRQLQNVTTSNSSTPTMGHSWISAVTPSDYQPPGFKEGECEGVIFEGEPMYLNVGEVPTPFHMLKVKVTTEKQRMENVDKSILKSGETTVPLQMLRVDRDEEEENQNMNEDPVSDNKVEDRNNVNISEAQEPNLTCEEDEVMKAGGNQNLYVSNPQVDHLASKTSELNVSESRTRSGKLFQASTVHQFELSSSQDVLPKRRKISEPKEQF
ncbi:PREDICTED: HORMA domain-containing protein 1 isoform X4 [Calidris pugnax]|uniref:HORMA domain-containing protein 1 isoform X4 n=1 Tax=Calidris pugnax TaxID=198806 RepID=UPI00071C5729|nr:PREDICTED: HORMA domain-containing protein 1 isoform X4 [Calidris pugnax]